jgi:MFS family permease
VTSPDVDDDTVGSPARGDTRLPAPLRPFANTQYRLLAMTLTAALLGTGAWTVALVWQVMTLGGGPIELSTAAVAGSVALLVAVLLGGVTADRVSRRAVLVCVMVVKAMATLALTALAATGAIEIWHLAVINAVLGVTDGFFYPAYTALLPSMLPGRDLLAANGVEGVLRPIAMMAAGPALAGVLTLAGSTWLPLAAIAAIQAVGILPLAAMHSPDHSRTQAAHESAPAIGHSHGSAAVGKDLLDGIRYGARTPWLLATILFASGIILLIQGPIDVLLPFAIADAGGAAADFALALTAFGIGGAVGSIAVSSRPFPRRYLTVLLLTWGAGTLPLTLIAFTTNLWVIVGALFLVGLTYSAGAVIWGTLLQRRVPSELLGRVSSLDFFVTLAFLPISVALAGPVGNAVGLAPVFLTAGIAPILLAAIAWTAADLRHDELAHPLDQDGPKHEAKPADSDQPTPEALCTEAACVLGGGTPTTRLGQGHSKAGSR